MLLCALSLRGAAEQHQQGKKTENSSAMVNFDHKSFFLGNEFSGLCPLLLSFLERRACKETEERHGKPRNDLSALPNMGHYKLFYN